MARTIDATVRACCPTAARARRIIRAVLALAAAASLSALAVASVYAFAFDVDRESNAFSVATTSIAINEDFPDVPPKIAQGLIPKRVAIENTGGGACFVRVAVELSNADAAAFASFEINEEHWSTVQPDGFSYYHKPLEPGGETEPIIEAVAIGPKPPDGYTSFDVVVVAESVQASDPSTGRSYPDGPTAFAAISTAPTS